MKKVLRAISIFCILIIFENTSTAATVTVSLPDTTVIIHPDSLHITVPVFCSDVSGLSVYALGMKMGFDSTVVKPKSVNVENSVCEPWGAVTIQFNNNALALASAGTQPLAGSGELFSITFERIGNEGDSTSLHVVEAVLNEGNPATEIQHGAIKITPVEKNVKTPTRFTVSNIYPNPFNPACRISYSIPFAGRLTVEVYDCLGRHVTQLIDQGVVPGHIDVVWNGLNKENVNVASGHYFVKSQFNGQIDFNKIIKIN